MNIATTLTMELRIGFTLKEEERMEDVMNALRAEFEHLGVTEHASINTEPEERDGEFVLFVYVTIPKGMEVVAQSPKLKIIQTSLHMAFMAAQQSTPKREQLH